MRRLPVVLALVVLVFSAPAHATEAITDATGRAVEHLRNARAAIAMRQGVDAGREGVLARQHLRSAVAASPSLAIRDGITDALTALEEGDPPRTLLEPLLASLAPVDGVDAYFATQRYVERAHYWLFKEDANLVAKELTSAAARLPYSEIDVALGAVVDLSGRALARLAQGNLSEADVLLANAERLTDGIVRVSKGIDTELVLEVRPPPVAAPPPPPEAPATESDLAPPAEFREGPVE